MSNLNNLKKTTVINNLSLKKKYFYSKKITKSIDTFKNILKKKQTHNKISVVLKKKINPNEKGNGFIVGYVISFSFSVSNTFFYVTDATGNLKFRYSAGLFDFKGRQKKRRIHVLKRFLRELQKLKRTTLKNKPIALHLNNVGSYKYFIIKNVKKKFFIRVIKSYETYSYNGCRKKKQLRK